MRATSRWIWPRSPGAAGQHRRARAVGDLEDGLDVACVAGDHDAHGFHLVHRGVGGVEEPGVGVEADLALDDLAKFVLEVRHAGSVYRRPRATYRPGGAAGV